MSDGNTFDALSALAPLLRVRPELQSLCRFGDPWASPHEREASGWAPFHMVTSGTCTLDVEGEVPLNLDAGDVALLPHGDRHIVRGAMVPGREPAPIRTETTDAIEIKSNADHPKTELICGRLAFEHANDNLVRAALPRLILVRTSEHGSLAQLRVLLNAIRAELVAAGPGARAISCDLASALLVMVLRAHFQGQSGQGFLKLLGERHTARVLEAMTQAPARVWTLDAMAACARTSRATLVRDFRRLASVTPFGVLAEIRLGVARHNLCASDRSLADIAIEAGYNSQSAFSRAFQRRFRVAPGALRQSHSSGLPAK